MIQRTSGPDGAYRLDQVRRPRAGLVVGVFSDISDEASIANVHSNRAAELLLGGDAELALAHLKDAVRLASSDPVHHNRMGLALKHLGRDREAKEALLRALDLDPGLGSALYNLACLQIRALQIPEALQSLRRAFATRPELFQELAGLDADLDALWALPAFQELVGEPPEQKLRSADDFDQ